MRFHAGSSAANEQSTVICATKKKFFILQGYKLKSLPQPINTKGLVFQTFTDQSKATSEVMKPISRQKDEWGRNVNSSPIFLSVKKNSSITAKFHSNASSFGQKNDGIFAAISYHAIVANLPSCSRNFPTTVASYLGA